MNQEQYVSLIRGFTLFYPLIIAVGLASYCRVSYRQLTGIFLAFLWCFCVLIFINPLIIELGWWTFNVRGGVFWKTPVDMILGWSILWSTVPNIVGRKWNVFLWGAIMFALDVIWMPFAAPAVELNSGWLWGELLCVSLVFIPSRLLAQWTFIRKNLYYRVIQQIFLFIAVFIILIPSAIIIASYGSFPDWSNFPPHIIFFLIFSLFILGLLSLSAFQEFAIRGKGTPIPMDPPKQLVITGPYAYLANPMQTSMTLLFIVMVMALENLWFYFAGLSAVIFSFGVSSWSEGNDMEKRFGENWLEYRGQVKMFLPRLKPWRAKTAVIYLDFSDCDTCKAMWDWIQKRNPVQLKIQDIAFYNGKNLNEMVYRDNDGYEESGIKALGRVLEHLNLIWALVGFLIRIPGVSIIAQLLFDAIAPHSVGSIGGKEKTTTS